MIEEGKIYQHYKGDSYLVLHNSIESTNGRDGTNVVVYLSLKKRTIHNRDLAQFVEIVEWPDGKRRARFTQFGKYI